MTSDQVIEIRKLWAKYNYGHQLPAATVLAEHDWTAYVQAMAAMVPQGDQIVWPTEAEVNWAWPDGVMIVFSEPVELHHTIISNTNFDRHERTTITATEPHTETQVLTGLAILPPQMAPTQTPEGLIGEAMSGTPVFWIGETPEDLVTGWWLPGVVLEGAHVGGISVSTRFLVSLVSALGHRLTRLELPVTAQRAERRRIERDLPGLRVLQLSSGASVKENKEPGKVEWSHRWITRGHWRQQPCGPKSQLRRMTWIDAFIKGPEDKPLDIRPTVWRTGQKTPEGRL